MPGVHRDRRLLSAHELAPSSYELTGYASSKPYEVIVLWRGCRGRLYRLYAPDDTENLRSGALRGWPTPLGVTLNTSIRLFDEEGDCIDSAAKSQLYTVGRQVVEFAVLRQRSQIAPAVLYKGELQATSYIHDRGGWT